MKQTVNDRLYQVIGQVFGVSVEQINEETSPDTTPNWDSLGHINLILAIETEFGVSLSPEDAMEMLSVKLIRMILEDLGVKDFL
jgi:acyl carrier protein